MKKFNSVTKRLLTVALSCVLFLGVFTCLLVTGQRESAFADTADTVTEEISEERVEVFSYVDVFETYYEQVIERLDEMEIEVPYTFEDFCEGYYSHDYDITTYTDLCVEYAADNSEYLGNNNISLYDSSIEIDAFYILSKDNYAVTPASVFKRVPKYAAYDYSSIRTGDIVLETKTILADTGHTAIISSVNKDSDYGKYVQTIEPVGKGVQFGYLDDSRMLEYGVIILRVANATLSQRNLAIDFCIQQLGKRYSLNTLRLNTSINSNEWYCSELMYAAYLYAGIDIGVRKDSSGNDYYMKLGCLPADIYKSYNTYSISIKENFIGLSISKKSGKTWTLNVKNNSSDPILCWYNSLMCNKSDAVNWTGLKNEHNIVIQPNQTIPIEVKENWFATSVAFCFIENGVRVVTYADGLSNLTKTLSLGHNVI